MGDEERDPREWTREDWTEWKNELGRRAAELQQRWHGWGSPVGLGLFLICLSLAISMWVVAGWLFTLTD
jgi:hypothetical protein